eukprot:jgi/Picre1/30591/NNA_005953.t1
MKARIGRHLSCSGIERTIQATALQRLGREPRAISPRQRQYHARVSPSESYQERECAPTTVISLQQGSTSINIPLSLDQLQSAKDAVRKIIGILSEKQTDTRPRKWESVDVTLQSNEGVSMNVFCNPNACMNAFDARVLLTVEDATSGIKVTMTDIGLQEFQNALSE